MDLKQKNDVIRGFSQHRDGEPLIRHWYIDDSLLGVLLRY